MSSITTLIFLAIVLLLQKQVSCQFSPAKVDSDIGELEGANFFLSESAQVDSGFVPSRIAAARQVKKNRRRIRKAVQTASTRADSCKPAVCFILDGSTAVGDFDWDAQTSFVQLVSAIIGGFQGSLFSAVEFTDKFSANVISGLDSFDPFAIAVATAAPSGRSQPNLRGAMEYCTTLLSANVGNTDFQKIVTLADLQTIVRGKNAAVNIARAWDGDDAVNPNPFNDMCGGVIGSTSKSFWVKLAGGIKTDVRRVPSWPLLIDIIVDLIEDICGPVPEA